MKPGKTGIARLVAATGYSMKGLKACFQGEAAFRQELLLVVALTPVSFWVARSTVEWILLMAPLLLLDRIGDEKHELSGRAKDMGSAAVLLSLVLIAITWLPIAYQRFQELS